MNYWFTADYHLGHKNIIKYCNRPFRSLEGMNRQIITNHNARVKKDDIVFHVGDFCFRNSPGGKDGEGTINKADYYEKQLNGKIIFIKGNHDRSNSCKTIIEELLIKYGGKYINLVHDPHFVNTSYEINLVGHIHEKWRIKRIRKGESLTDAINVGVDVWGFKPVNWNEIMARYHRWKNNYEQNERN